MTAVLPFIALLCLVSGFNPETDPPEVERTKPKTPSTTIVEKGDWAESFEEARRISSEKKIPLILHFEASWCGACLRMQSQVLDKPAVRELLGQRVIGVRIDADRHRDLIDRYRVSTLPTEIVIAADGSERSRYVGAVSLKSWVSRLQSVAKRTMSATSDGEATAPAARQNSRSDADIEKTRSCLIVRHDGKLVGMGGFSPVALSEDRRWRKGHEEFVASFQGVDYFLQSADEVDRFEARPGQFVPHLHGCDPVELHRSKLARTGVIEFGAFYKGHLFFFASVENRIRFQNNPAWYLSSDQQPDTDHEAAQLLDMIR